MLKTVLLLVYLANICYLSERGNHDLPLLMKHVRHKILKRADTEPIYSPVIGQTDTDVKLSCPTGQQPNKNVSWIKRANDGSTNVITMGNKTVDKDKRFISTSEDNNKNWQLTIRYAQLSDQGLYECRVPAKQPFSVFWKLELKEAYAELTRGGENEIKAGSPLRLSCVINDVRVTPEYIFWYHDDRLINYDLNSTAAIRQGRQGSELIFPKAEAYHSGNYSCVPSNAKQDSLYVEVIPLGDRLTSSQGNEADLPFPFRSFMMLSTIFCHTTNYFSL